MSTSNEEIPFAHRALKLLGSVLAPEVDLLAGRGNKELEESMLDRIKRHIEQHLEYSELSPESICRHVGISRSQLYRLFSGTGGVANYIRTARLLKAKAALSSVPRPRISNVAYKYGFTSHAHFSRVFKQYFGHTPWECVADSPGSECGHMSSNGSAGDYQNPRAE